MRLSLRCVSVLCGLWMCSGFAHAAQKKPMPAAKPAVTPKPATVEVTTLSVEPPRPILQGARAAQTLIVTATLPDGSWRDVTREATFRSESPKVAAVTKNAVTSIADGTATIAVSYGGKTMRVSVEVKDSKVERPISFTHNVTPILSRAGCNNSACHAEGQNGKGGFKLSLFGYEPAQDFDAVTKSGMGRRVSRSDPEKSLIVLKPTMQISHGGGQRLQVGSPEYQSLVEWVRAGMSAPSDKDLKVTQLDLYPADRVFTQKGQQQQLVAVAHLSDGTVQDVTHKARFVTNDEGMASVTRDGLVTAEGAGFVTIMVRYLGGVNAFKVTNAFNPPIQNYPNVQVANVIDEKVVEKLKQVRMTPSDVCSDEEFIRRVYVDIVGTLPKPDEVRAFVADKSADKRAKLVDALLQRPEYGHIWAIRWGDVLRINARYMREGTVAFRNYIKDSFNADKPLDEFAREMILAQGNSWENGPPNYYVAARQVEDMTTTTTQLFLGVRIQCAQCHDHPFEKWTQNDFHSFAAFFARTRVQGRNQAGFNVIEQPRGEWRQPRTGEIMKPLPLGSGQPMTDVNGNRRQVLAEWMTRPDNPYFARAMANRVWKHFFGRGIVEPIDDFRLTNPPTNEPLLDAIAKHLVDNKFSQKALIRLICNSRTYQSSSAPNATNKDDAQYFAKMPLKRMLAEVLLDAVSDATGVPEQFGRQGQQRLGVNVVVTRAIELPDPLVPSYFLDVFGRTPHNTIEERMDEGSVQQVLAMVNSDSINNRITSPRGRLMQLVRSGKNDEAIVEELYLATLSRFPTVDEMAKAKRIIASSPTREEGLQDVFWVLLNSKEFMFNH